MAREGWQSLGKMHTDVREMWQGLGKVSRIEEVCEDAMKV